MLIDRRASGHLIWGHDPFVSPWEEVIGQFSPVSPPRISIYPEADQATFGVAPELVIGFTYRLWHPALSALAQIAFPVHASAPQPSRGRRRRELRQAHHGLGVLQGIG